MIVVYIVCGWAIVIGPMIFLAKVSKNLETIKLIAKENGEEISKFYGCGGLLSSEHINFGKKYAPELVKKNSIYESLAVLSALVPAAILIALIKFK